jgi:hypothetical protein
LTRQASALVTLVKYLAGFLNIFREEVFGYPARAMKPGNHEPRALGVIAVAVFFLYGLQGDWSPFSQIVVKIAG